MAYSSDKFCLKWNDFEQNIVTSYKEIRKESDFSDMTLACEGDTQIEAHKIILSACSPFFRNLLKKTQHSHPMIYMRGLRAKDLEAILDFIYHGEANIYQQDLDGFLGLAEELQLKGLAGSQENTLDAASKQNHATQQPKTNKKLAQSLDRYYQSTDTDKNESFTNTKVEYIPKDMEIIDSTKILVAQETSMDDLKTIIDSMMEQVHDGENKWKCTVCGKATIFARDLRRHIETHMEGLSYPCNQCGKISRSSNALKCHITRHQNN